MAKEEISLLSDEVIGKRLIEYARRQVGEEREVLLEAGLRLKNLQNDLK